MDAQYTWEDAVKQCEHILELCAQVGGAGRAFAESVSEKVESIAETITQRQSVTEGQQLALGNMQRGVEKWIRR